MVRQYYNYRVGGKWDTLSPYRIAASLVKDRLVWDITFNSWRHRKRIKSVHNKYYGQKAVILCNGPSLNDVDFDLLGNVYCFGLNKINLLFDRTDFRPSAIVAVNPFIIDQNAKFYFDTDITLFLDSYAKNINGNIGSNVHLLHTSDHRYFSRDCSMSVYKGHTVTYVALQLAYYMGFTQIALVGCDHLYMNPGEPNQLTQNTGVDESHFTEEYFTQDQLWQHADLKASEYDYELSRRCYEEDDRNIYNASTRSELTCFTKMPLEQFLSID